MSLTEYKVEAKVFVIDKTDVSIKKEYPSDVVCQATGQIKAMKQSLMQL